MAVGAQGGVHTILYLTSEVLLLEGGAQPFYQRALHYSGLRKSVFRLICETSEVGGGGVG